MSTKALCTICGEPMPENEAMFKFHGYSGPCPKPPLPVPETFQEYLEKAERSGVIDFSLRIVRTPDGLLDFYIHPQGRDGDTGDFHVSGGAVRRIADSLGAGSSRPVA